MTYAVYGGLGMLAVLLLMAAGALLGWRLRVVYVDRAKKTVEETRTEEELRRLREEQDAFDTMLSYNIGDVYRYRSPIEESLETRFRER